MAKQELIQVLDFILNRCSSAEIEVVAAAVVRRRKDIEMFGDTAHVPDPGRLAKEINAQFNLEGAIEGLSKSVRDFAIRTIRQEAPELSDAQIEELTRAWIPGPGGKKSAKEGGAQSGIPRNILASMIDQFVSFSVGRMEEEEDMALRKEMGPWPDKYWKSFPQLIRLLISDFLKGEMEESDFNSRIGLALNMQ
ncbi:MAG: hypothetical protein LBF78_14550 [Treponema sp.]|jgi:hypothetical protein|nr:hypothetical protein [Treponema sp.]